MLTVARRQPLVIVTGSEDYNREQCEAYAQAYQADGFDAVTYLEVPGMAHTYPDANTFGQVLDHLDTRLDPTRAEQVRRDAATRQLAQALAERDSHPARARATLLRLARSAINTPAGRSAARRLALDAHAQAVGRE